MHMRSIFYFGSREVKIMKRKIVKNRGLRHIKKLQKKKAESDFFSSDSSDKSFDEFCFDMRGYTPYKLPTRLQ